MFGRYRLITIFEENVMEEIVKKNLDFLCNKHGMKYSKLTFQNYLGRDMSLDTYNYYNENGCFSVLSIEVRGDLNFACFDSISFLYTYASPEFMKSHKYKINVTKIEKEIWKKHEKIFFFKNPFFWWSNRRVFRALREVIENQIKKTSQFYGINIAVKK